MEQERINIACHSQNNGKSMIQGIFPMSHHFHTMIVRNYDEHRK